MVTNLIAQDEAQLMESVLLGGDLSKLAPTQRVNYYRKVCESIGLNPLTKPFDYMTLNGKLTLYAKKDATDQLRNINKVSIDDVDILETEKQFIVKVKGHDITGRTDVEVGVVNKTDMQGNLANAQMKAVTKAKRRLTLSLCGLGWLDETEVQTIPDARPVVVAENGEIVNASPIAENPEPETINQETGIPTPVIQMYNYSNSNIVEAVKKITKWSNQEASNAVHEAYRKNQIGKSLTIEEAEQFARKMVEPQPA